MYFRSLKKSAGDVSLSDTIESEDDNGSLSLMDVLYSQDDMLEAISINENCRMLRERVERTLTERESQIINLRYGLNGETPKTQRETAKLCGISRSYVSRIEKKALEKLRAELEREGT